VLDTFQRTINFGISMAIVFMTLLVALAGFSYIASRGNAEGRSLANKRIMNAAIGLLIALGAFLLVDSLMKAFYNPNNAAFGPWNSILGQGSADQCLAPSKPPSSFAALNSPANGNGGSGVQQAPAVTPSNPGASGLNISDAVNYLTSNVKNTNFGGQCLSVIRRALSVGGVSLSCGAPTGHTEYAGYCNSSLQALHFTLLGSSDSSPQPGDIVVIQHSSGTKIGHIAMWTGSNWISDAVQPNSETPPGNPYGADGYDPHYWRP
jgi:hypothetical protein